MVATGRYVLRLYLHTQKPSHPEKTVSYGSARNTALELVVRRTFTYTSPRNDGESARSCPIVCCQTAHIENAFYVCAGKSLVLATQRKDVVKDTPADGPLLSGCAFPQPRKL